MKTNIIICVFMFFCAVTNAQVVNGSFENASGPDISNWEWTCSAVLANTAPPNGGFWSLFVEGGNTQSCFPGYAYQKIPSISNGQAFILSAWALASSSQMSGHHVGIYFGKINNGVITLQDGDTTSSTSWTSLSVQSGFSLGTGDTAVVVLFGGLVGGPLQANGIFDLIALDQITAFNELESPSSTILYPNPATNNVLLHSDKYLNNTKCKIFNVFGKQVKEIQSLMGKSLTFSIADLPAGTYYLHVIQDQEIISRKNLVVVK